MPYFGIPIRNGLPIGLGSVAGFGAFQFSPSVLFAAGEQGAWYDPSDFSTLYQDPAGTTPVTAVEQAIGLMLDKSRGLVLGPELVTNGDFSSGTTGFTQVNSNTSGSSVINGEFNVVSSASGSGGFTQDVSVTLGATYLVVVKARKIAGAGAVRFQTYDGASFSNFIRQFFDVSTVGNQTTYTAYIKTSLTSTLRLYLYADTSTTGGFDDVSVKLVPGNHATAYNSGAARPILRARYNLLTYSEQFNNTAGWLTSNVTVSANTTATTDPIGGNTADKIEETNTNGAHVVYTTSALALLAAQYKISVYVKAAERTFARIDLVTSGYASGSTVILNLSTGATTITNYGATTGTTATAVSVGNGWYQLSMTLTATATSWFLQIGPEVSSTPANYVGTTGSGIFVWGADLRTSADAALNIPAYQRIAAATDYDTSGFPVYIDCDGSDDGMSTASIDFTGTDKMTVFAGVTKLSDAAAFSVIAELGNWNTNVDGATLATRSGPEYANGLLNTAGLYPIQAYSTFAAPISNVLTSLYDRAGATVADELAMRVNGVNISGVSVGTAAIPASNFGNLPFFFFSRNNASLRFRGRVYSLIIRGASTTTPLIQATEQWVAGKMRLTL